MTDNLNHEDFWNHLKSVQAGMLHIEPARPVPMSPYPDPAQNAIWFITAVGTDVEAALRGGEAFARFIVASPDAQLYATIDGRARLDMDRAKLDEIWNAVASAWFEEGEDDPDIALVRVDLNEAEVWVTDGSLSFLYQIAKSNITEEKPDMGSHGKIGFAA